jgi:hypothetical protein
MIAHCKPENIEKEVGENRIFWKDTTKKKDIP